MTDVELVSEWGFRPETLETLFGEPIPGPDGLPSWLVNHVLHVDQTVIKPAVALLESSLQLVDLADHFDDLDIGSGFKARPNAAHVVGKLSRSVAISREHGAVEGFRYLNNDGSILVLGPAFFTKWLYFVAARGNPVSPAAAPVLDALVIQWMRRYAGVRLRSGRTRDYRTYVDHLTSWGMATGHAPVEVEERIFRLIRSDGAASG